MVPGTDEEVFASLHSVLARHANYDAVAARIGGDGGYASIVNTLRAVGAQHPDAMWLVRAWWVDGVVASRTLKALGLQRSSERTRPADRRLMK